MSLTDNSSVVASAYHESAHAYFCYLFGQQIETVSIDGQSVTKLAFPEPRDYCFRKEHGQGAACGGASEKGGAYLLPGSVHRKTGYQPSRANSASGAVAERL